MLARGTLTALPFESLALALAPAPALAPASAPALALTLALASTLALAFNPGSGSDSASGGCRKNNGWRLRDWCITSRGSQFSTSARGELLQLQDASSIRVWADHLVPLH